MSITISADDPRTIRAIEIAAEADQWLMYRNGDGQQMYGVPSQSEPRRYYVVTTQSCDCADYARNALAVMSAAEASEVRACKHVLAAMMAAENRERAPS